MDDYVKKILFKDNVQRNIQAYYLLIISVLGLSCASVKPTIKENPRIDSEKTIFYFMGKSPYEASNALASQRLLDSGGTVLYDSPRGSGFVLFQFDTSNQIIPSISPFGRYIATYHEKFKLANIKWSVRQKDFSIYDLQKNDFILELTTRIPRLEYQDEAYSIPWSANDTAFYIIDSDTIKKFYPDGRRSTLGYFDGLSDFSISPSEKKILVVQEDKVNLYDATAKSITELKTFDNFLGLSQSRFIRSTTWFSDENKVAFAEGGRIYLYDVVQQKLLEHKADAEVFAIEWLPNGEIVYVAGEYPSNISQLQMAKSFKMYRYSFNTDEVTLLHDRLNHEPLSVKPKLSPSRKLLLFSEQRLNGYYEVKLMTLDGKEMNTICDGHSPTWAK